GQGVRGGGIDVDVSSCCIAKREGSRNGSLATDSTEISQSHVARDGGVGSEVGTAKNRVGGIDLDGSAEGRAVDVHHSLGDAERATVSGSGSIQIDGAIAAGRIGVDFKVSGPGESSGMSARGG